MAASVYLMTAVLALAPGQRPTASGSSVILKACLVTLLEECKVAAEEPGILTIFDVKEGRQVEAGALLAGIRATKAEAAKRVAEAEQKVAQEQAEDDIEKRYAQAAADVSLAVYKKYQEANKQKRGAVTETELLRLKLEWQRAVLQIEKAEHDRTIAGLTAEAKQAIVDSSVDDIERRQIRAPIAGEVVEVFQKLGQWVNPGDPIAHLVRFDRLRVEGMVAATDLAPYEVHDRPVTVKVQVKSGREETFKGKIVFVNQLVRANGEYQVIAEVENRQERSFWLLRPGQIAEMTLEVTPAPRAAAAKTAERTQARNPSE